MNLINGDNISEKEKSKICHEINNLYYSKYSNISPIAHRSIGLDKRYYIYLVENLGFDNYRFLMRFENLDDEGESNGYQ